MQHQQRPEAASNIIMKVKPGGDGWRESGEKGNEAKGMKIRSLVSKLTAFNWKALCLQKTRGMCR